ncbi:hypothetical protein [Kineosporia sp. A_224]|uniref:hypothetical protein n=1 Tax=Kineosporia sp. A_224 TaxID=1962180 RepID=UPI000B4A8EBD|nr:hypothetical protein [Kineosporia sp. A_224]
MSTVFTGVRRGDVALAAVVTAVGVQQTAMNAGAPADWAVRIDSHSWWSVPLFAAATLPLLWRRRSMFVVLAVTAAALALHVLAFGWMVRCTAGLVLTAALAYSAGRLLEDRSRLVGLAAVVGVQVLVLVEDSAAGLEILWAAAPIAAACWGAGWWLERSARSRTSDAVPSRVGAGV